MPPEPSSAVREMNDNCSYVEIWFIECCQFNVWLLSVVEVMTRLPIVKHLDHLSVVSYIFAA